MSLKLLYGHYRMTQPTYSSFSGNSAICLYVPGGINNAKEVTSNVFIEKLEDCYVIPSTYLDLNKETKITCDITYNDGTQDTITVYFTWREE